MTERQMFSIYTLRLRHERHVVHARQRARDIAALLGFDHQEQIRIATAVSELARNAFRYATGGAVEFLVRDGAQQVFIVLVTDSGPGIPNLRQILDGQYISKTGLGKGIVGTKRLLERFEIGSSVDGTRVEIGKEIPSATPRIDAVRVKQLLVQLANSSPADPFDEIERQNQELVRTLSELREKQETLAELNQELEDTNRGVVALYAELDQRADDLRRVSDLKTSFLSNLSHEFRTPLNSISSLSQLLLSRSDGDLTAEQEKQVSYIQRSASELSEMVNDLLDLAKVEAGKIDVKPRVFEAQELFGALRGMLKPLLVGNSLDLIFEANANLDPLYSDEGKISQILRNLISNALKFTRRGQVRVTAEAGQRDMVVFRVSDTGIGIAAEDLERIFEEFVQVDGEMQARVRGTGLGLPLSRRLAALLGGTLEVESTLGVGSTFTVAIPMRLADLAPLDLSRMQASASGPTVLFIEDNRETIFVYESSMKNTNYNLVFARNLIEARAAINQKMPVLIVLDRLIDQHDSLFFIQEQKSQGYGGPVIVVSVVDDEKAALDAGAIAFLAKPVPPFALMNAIRELVEGQNSKAILLAEDDEVTRYLLGDTLTRFGYRILEARNGREAIRIVLDRQPDAVFLDLVMPDQNGFEVLREIRNNPLTQSTPVIIHSSKSLSASEIDLLTSAGAVIYPKEAFGSKESLGRLHEALSAAGLQT
jgi:signal transduction histidine kinase/DNA-binding response OmpR family regulator